METAIATIEDLKAETTRFIQDLAPAIDGATLVTLSGELGAGKTAFTKAVADALGVAGVVTSPTFVLEKIYILPPYQAWQRLVHIDAYRLKNGSDLAALGFDELMQDTGNLVMLEWPEVVADALPKPAATIHITNTPDGARTISYG